MKVGLCVGVFVFGGGGVLDSKSVCVERLTVPDGEGSFVHLHAHKEGIFGKLDGGDEVERRLGFKADLHACPHKVQIHRNISGDHQRSPVSNEAFNEFGTSVQENCGIFFFFDVMNSYFLNKPQEASVASVVRSAISERLQGTTAKS